MLEAGAIFLMQKFERRAKVRDVEQVRQGYREKYKRDPMLLLLMMKMA